VFFTPTPNVAQVAHLWHVRRAKLEVAGEEVPHAHIGTKLCGLELLEGMQCSWLQDCPKVDHQRHPPASYVHKDRVGRGFQFACTDEWLNV
jgi:hypothetical protein